MDRDGPTAIGPVAEHGLDLDQLQRWRGRRRALLDLGQPDAARPGQQAQETSGQDEPANTDTHPGRALQQIADRSAPVGVGVGRVVVLGAAPGGGRHRNRSTVGSGCRAVAPFSLDAAVGCELGRGLGQGRQLLGFEASAVVVAVAGLGRNRRADDLTHEIHVGRRHLDRVGRQPQDRIGPDQVRIGDRATDRLFQLVRSLVDLGPAERVTQVSLCDVPQVVALDDLIGHAGAVVDGAGGTGVDQHLGLQGPGQQPRTVASYPVGRVGLGPGLRRPRPGVGLRVWVGFRLRRDQQRRLGVGRHVEQPAAPHGLGAGGDRLAGEHRLALVQVAQLAPPHPVTEQALGHVPPVVGRLRLVPAGGGDGSGFGRQRAVGVDREPKPGRAHSHRGVLDRAGEGLARHRHVDGADGGGHRRAARCEGRDDEGGSGHQRAGPGLERR